MQNEAAEAEELKAFRYHMRCSLAAPLLAARAALGAAAPGAAPDFLALSDAIVADLEAGSGVEALPAAAAPPEMRRRSRGAVNPLSIAEEGEEEEAAA